MLRLLILQGGSALIPFATSRYNASRDTPISSANCFHVPLRGSSPSFQASHASSFALTVFNDMISARFRVA
ncbi:hypothetical protein LP421_02790 (plasmid) [Rhizobium sp. RCAM05350]|nr:hypothetical protein LP421_02790 [Rhizobium sp. RCAM05350]